MAEIIITLFLGIIIALFDTYIITGLIYSITYRYYSYTTPTFFFWGLLSTAILIVAIINTINIFPLCLIMLFISCILLGVHIYTELNRYIYAFAISLIVLFGVFAYEYTTYIRNFEPSSTPTVEITTVDVEEIKFLNSENAYVCKLDNKTTKTLPASITQIYSTDSENIYYEELTTTTEIMDMNQYPTKAVDTKAKLTYSLYIPEKQLKHIFEVKTSTD